MAVDISLEIIPRSAESVREDIGVYHAFPALTRINIPDLPRFSLRSWEVFAGAGAENALPAAFIPHLRARYFSPDAPFPHTALFREHGVTRALVIAGDPDGPDERLHDAHRPWEDSPTLPFIRKLKAEMPELEIYAAFDPYRTNIRYELDYLALKEEAGAAGFMSQPFFDIRLLEIYSEYLEGKNVFWGVAPVLTAGSRNYWESRNRSIFPRSFRADLYWNVAYGRQVLDFCRKNGFNLYLMPIKVDLAAYLGGLFGTARD
jgi:methylenetetrahydrofolate reductase (NADPH)